MSTIVILPEVYFVIQVNREGFSAREHIETFIVIVWLQKSCKTNQNSFLEGVLQQNQQTPHLC